MARPGKVRRTVTGSHVWKRPNEKVKLRNFNSRQVNAIRPALIALDSNLQPHVKLNASIKVARPGQVERSYARHYDSRRATKVGALTYPRRIRKNKVYMNPKVFHGRSTYHPTGVLAHEVGHLAHIQSGRYSQMQWKKATGSKRGKTRQTHNVHEDFAESFRASLNQPLTRKRNRYFNVRVDQPRQAHLNSYYLKNERSKAAKKGWRKRKARGR